MTAPYTPAAWYWKVAGSTTQVFSSAAAAYVPVSDAAYVAWLARGNSATIIDAEQSLWDVLDGAGVALPSGASVSDPRKTAEIATAGRVALAVMFNHENRIRALESKVAFTKPQFVAAIKTLL